MPTAAGFGASIAGFGVSIAGFGASIAGFGASIAGFGARTRRFDFSIPAFGAPHGQRAAAEGFEGLENQTIQPISRWFSAVSAQGLKG